MGKWITWGDTSLGKSIFLIFSMTIMIAIPQSLAVIHNQFGLKYFENNDVANWAALIVEIEIGAAITLSILSYSRKIEKDNRIKQEKISQLVNEVKNMEKIQLEMDKKLLEMIEQKEKSRIAREKIVIEHLSFRVESIKIDMYERKKYEIALKENKPNGYELSSLLRGINFDIDKLEEQIIIDRNSIPVEHIGAIESIIQLSKFGKQLDPWKEHNYTIHDELKKQINALLEKLHQMHPSQMKHPYENDPDYK